MGLATAAVVIVAIVSASAVAVFWIGVSSRNSSPQTVTVTVTETAPASAGNSSSRGGSQSGTAAVRVTKVTAPTADFATKGTTMAFTCNLIAGSGAYLVLTNTGTQPAALTGVTITWAGANNAFSPPPAGCAIGPAGSSTATLYINLPDPATLSVAAVPGQTFQGAVTFSSGAAAPFTGTFQ
jgi:hypothetical protein